MGCDFSIQKEIFLLRFIFCVPTFFYYFPIPKQFYCNAELQDVRVRIDADNNFDTFSFKLQSINLFKLFSLGSKKLQDVHTRTNYCFSLANLTQIKQFKFMAR